MSNKAFLRSSFFLVSKPKPPQIQTLSTNTINAEIIIKTAIKAWDAQISRFGKLILAMPDDQFYLSIAPGKNSTLYIVGHLIAVNDYILLLLGVGEREYHFLDYDFIKHPDTFSDAYPSLATLWVSWQYQII